MKKLIILIILFNSIVGCATSKPKPAPIPKPIPTPKPIPKPPPLPKHIDSVSLLAFTPTWLSDARVIASSNFKKGDTTIRKLYLLKLPTDTSLHKKIILGSNQVYEQYYLNGKLVMAHLHDPIGSDTLIFKKLQ